ncbi:MAG: hypothetical protein KDH96_07460 [Candidatus Riesia sp.]|nr:hypothetical protein [Candidatus Riesia sp.]
MEEENSGITFYPFTTEQDAGYMIYFIPSMADTNDTDQLLLLGSVKFDLPNRTWSYKAVYLASEEINQYLVADDLDEALQALYVEGSRRWTELLKGENSDFAFLRMEIELFNIAVVSCNKANERD